MGFAGCQPNSSFREKLSEEHVAEEDRAGQPTPSSALHTHAHPTQQLLVTLTLFQLVATTSDYAHFCQKLCLAGLAEGTGACADSRHWLSENTVSPGNSALAVSHPRRRRVCPRKGSRLGVRGEL